MVRRNRFYDVMSLSDCAPLLRGIGLLKGDQGREGRAWGMDQTHWANGKGLALAAARVCGARLS